LGLTFPRIDNSGETVCTINGYEFHLLLCETEYCNNPVGNHKADVVCQDQNITGLNNCVRRARFNCVIVDGPRNPTEDAFIEWYWASAYNTVVGHQFVTGKFTFMANATWINQVHTLWRGYTNPRTTHPGIPLFNPSNHNTL